MNVVDRLCRRVRLNFSDAMDGQPLPLVSRVFVRIHLTFCPRCKRHMDSLRSTRDALRELGAQDVTPGPDADRARR